MGLFTLQFQNKELESQYQAQQYKYIQKQSKYYISILMIGKCISIIDNIRFSQYLMMSIAIAFIIVETSMVYLIKTKRIDAKSIVLYANMLSFGSSLTQIIMFYFKDYFQLSEAQFYVQLDIIHQGITLFNYGQSHLDSSVLYIIFIASKVFLQIEMFEYTSLSMTFSFYSLFYMIDSYQKAKQRRKQFLKSLRNKSLELLIQEFIDDRVCILEKDEDNVRLIPIMINDKIRLLSQDIHNMLKLLKIQKSNLYLQNYLYMTNNMNERLLCKYKKQFYQVTYQRFISKKCQIFIKINQIYQNQYYAVNYKELYYRQQSHLLRLSQQSYHARQISKQLQEFQFIFWFQKYYLAYKPKIESVNLKQINQLMNARQFNIIQITLKENQIYTDKLLFNLLLKSIQKYLKNRHISMKENNNIIYIGIHGEEIKPIKQEQLTFINKLLFHTGIGMVKVSESEDFQCHIGLRLLNLKQKYFRLI